MVRPNATKRKLREGAAVFGCILMVPSPQVVELLGAAGFDLVLLDAEHGGVNEGNVEDLVRAAELWGMTPLARVPDHEESTVLRYLERGVQGVMAPRIRSRAEAEALVRACLYPPQGARGMFSGGRANRFGELPPREYAAAANAEMLCIAMCEDPEGLEHVAEVAATPGLDVVEVGPGDLAASLGFPPPEELERVIQRIIATVQGVGKAVGIGGFPYTQVERWRAYRDKGVRYFQVNPSDFIKTGGREWLQSVRGQP